MKRLVTSALALILTACAGGNTASPTGTPLQTAPVVAATPTEIPASETSAPTAVPASDLFTQAGITLPAPACESGPTPLDTEGPYYKADTPARTSLLEQGMQGTRLILAGHVLDTNCNPAPNAWLDFWQADANGEYDNTGYILRAHQFTDAQGRYFLETIAPGLYTSRPIIHIHVKLQLPGGEVKTTQLYFPDQPIQNQTVTLEERDGYLVGYFNFVVDQ